MKPVHKLCKLKEWSTPASLYPDGKVGKARLKTANYTRGQYQCYGIKGFDFFQAMRPLPIKSLQVAGKTWMVDDPPHWWAMEEHATFYRGHVVVAGLGLGLIVHTLAACPDVERITVVEVEPDVITLVQPHLPPSAKVEIVAGDFWEWEGQPDGVFYDLFVGDGLTLAAEALRTMLELRERFPGATTLRIHGFNNAKLCEMTEEISYAGRLAWQQFWGRAL
jgi:hypothetical protein